MSDSILIICFLVTDLNNQVSGFFQCSIPIYDLSSENMNILLRSSEPHLFSTKDRLLGLQLLYSSTCRLPERVNVIFNPFNDIFSMGCQSCVTVGDKGRRSNVELLPRRRARGQKHFENISSSFRYIVSLFSQLVSNCSQMLFSREASVRRCASI